MKQKKQTVHCERITNEDFIKDVELLIKKYKREHEYHQSIADEYLERIEIAKKNLVRFRKRMK